VAIGSDALSFTLDGPIREDSPARASAAAAIGGHLAAHGGVALIIDYGHPQSADGDTLQAVRGHAFGDVLADPAEQDLTAHVDFEALAKAAAIGSVSVTPLVSQGEWLERLGIQARATGLAKAHPERSPEIASAVRRLTASDAMGDLFKVLAVHAADWPRPAGLE